MTSHPNRKKSVSLTSKDRQMGPDKLRYEARLAFLDDRNARALELNRKAAALEREAKVAV